MMKKCIRYCFSRGNGKRVWRKAIVNILLYLNMYIVHTYEIQFSWSISNFIKIVYISKGKCKYFSFPHDLHRNIQIKCKMYEYKNVKCYFHE